jgi:hypothetical protein
VYGLCHQTFEPLDFSFAVDEFGVNYGGDNNPHDLVNAIYPQYGWTADPIIRLKWSYVNHSIECSIMGCIAAALHNPSNQCVHNTHHTKMVATQVQYLYSKGGTAQKITTSG